MSNKNSIKFITSQNIKCLGSLKIQSNKLNHILPGESLAKLEPQGKACDRILSNGWVSSNSWISSCSNSWISSCSNDQISCSNDSDNEWDNDTEEEELFFHMDDI